MTSHGPISAALEADLRTWVRRHGIVVWLDLDGHYSDFVDQLIQARRAGELPYAVHSFRGSYLQLMLELEEVASGVERSRVVVHLPGFNEDAVRTTPLLELYAPGVRYRKKLETLVTEAAAGRVPPDEITTFTTQEGLTLASADGWLAAQLDDRAEGGAHRALQSMELCALMDDLLSGGGMAQHLTHTKEWSAAWSVLAARTGLPPEWREAALPGGARQVSDVAFALASWALAVEYVDDLSRAPVAPRLAGLGDLPRAIIDANKEIAAHLRERHGTFYQRTADETEGWLAKEVEAAEAEDLGRIDTFRFEEDKVLKAALTAVEDEQWARAQDWATPRVAGGSFWLREDPTRLSAWQLLADAVALGEALTAAGPTLSARSLLQAAERYTTVGAAVDRAHRHLEQRRTALLYPQLPEFEALRARLAALRRLWRFWADTWAEEFSALCRKQGFLPDEDLQQRTLFDQVVRPLTKEPGPTALFVVDALRYEMGQELFEAIDGTPATTAHLRPRFAELPTVTEVGMNALAPVARSGRLAPAVQDGAFKGFSTGEFRVRNPDTRNRAMWDRVGGATCPWLKLGEVLGRDSTSLKQAVARADLVVVHSIEIDSAGEKGVGPAVFDTVMQQLRAAWRLLRDAGVRRFVFTSDHGFLLLDESERSVVPYGRTVDPKRRHVVSTTDASPVGAVRVPLADLGYDDTEGLQLLFPASTAVFDTGNRDMSFVHGGNSLQERIIPVLTVVHRAAAGSDLLRYFVEARALEGVANMHCLSARLQVVSQGQLAFGGTREVELSLRVVEDVAAQVELCQVRGGARIAGGAIHVAVGERFELFFKLAGDRDARVRIELFHGAAVAEVTPCVLSDRFLMTGSGRGSGGDQPREIPGGVEWLEGLDANVRQVLQHLEAHGAVTEAEVHSMMGGARGGRRFARKFEAHRARAPFDIRIDSVGGVKRYVREGSKA